MSKYQFRLSYRTSAQPSTHFADITAQDHAECKEKLSKALNTPISKFDYILVESLSELTTPREGDTHDA